MRLLPLLAAAALLAGCPSPASTPDTAGTADTQPASTGSQPATTPAPAKLSSNSKLYIDGVEVTKFESVPTLNFTGVGVDGKIALSTAKNANHDRSYSLEIRMQSMGSKNGLARDFKPADINRLYFDMNQFILGKSRGNAWSGIVDIPSSKITSSFTHEGDRLGGSIEMTLEPDGGNEADYKKPIKVKYEFENELKI